MRPVVIELGAELDGPTSVVWKLLTDWERQGEWMLEASDFEVVTAHREGIGVEAEATVRIAGIATRDRIRVDAWEPERHLGIAHLGWVKGRGDLMLRPITGGRTRVDWREELVAPWGVIGAAGLRIFRPLMARVFRRDLHALAELVRRAAGGRYPEDA
jgi:hypothetical protein